MCGRPIASAAPAFGDGALECHFDAVLVEPRDDLLRAIHPLLLRAIARGLDRLDVHPVAADVEVLGVLVDAGHLDGRDVPDSKLLGGRICLGHAGNAVVVG